MCDPGLEGATVWSEKWVRARVDHRCNGCDPRRRDAPTIHPGDLYWTFVGLWDGDWNHGKHCAACHAIFVFLVEINAPNLVDLDLNCGETLDDPNDPAHALAFWSNDDGQRYAEWCKSQEDDRRRAVHAARIKYMSTTLHHPPEEHHAI